MAVQNVTINWVAALDADVDTEYLIESDKGASGIFVEVDTVPATERAASSGIYTPFQTTLSPAIDAEDTDLTLSPATNFAEGNVIVIDREPIRLGPKPATPFTNCERGIGGAIPKAHSNNAVAYKAHESYVDTVDFGSRRVIRYRVKRVQGSDVSIAAEILAINPPEPPSTDFCTVYTIIQSIQNAPRSGVPLQLTIGDQDNYIPTGELIEQTAETALTDLDGFGYFFVPKSIARQGGDEIRFTINPGTSKELSVVLTDIPDLSNTNFLRIGG